MVTIFHGIPYLLKVLRVFLYRKLTKIIIRYTTGISNKMCK